MNYHGLSLVTMVTLSMSSAVSAQDVDAVYQSWPTYAGEDLELTVDNGGTHWRLWSPAADAARVLIYPTDRNSAAVDTIEMTRGENGTWVANRSEIGRAHV